jgi:glycosyltransferase involved in cell wall biosynthesis
MKKKKLLVITSTFPRWQHDTDPPFVFELARRLTGSFDVTVLAPGYPGALGSEEVAGLRVHRFRYFFKKLELLAGSEGILPTLKKNPLFYLLVPFFLMGELAALIKLSRKIKPDIIHAHWIIPQGFIAALAKRVTGVPYVVTTHGGDIYGMQGKFASVLKRYALRHASHTTVVSRNIRETISRKFGEEIPTEIVPMGVDSELFHPAQKSKALREKYGIAGPFLLFVGRLTEKKGVKYLIEAMPEVVKKFPAVILLVVGTGEQRLKLERQVHSFGIEKNVIFAGAIPNRELPAYFATADIFIGPSIQAEGGDTEGFGLTFVEAAMSGCSVVATDVGGISDIIKDGETGFLVPEKDPHAIGAVLLKILQQDTSVNIVKEHTREQMVQKFDWQAIADRYAAILGHDARP